MLEDGDQVPQAVLDWMHEPRLQMDQQPAHRSQLPHSRDPLNLLKVQAQADMACYGHVQLPCCSGKLCKQHACCWACLSELMVTGNACVLAFADAHCDVRPAGAAESPAQL